MNNGQKIIGATLTPLEVTQFISIARRDYGVSISDVQARDEAQRLVDLSYVIFRHKLTKLKPP